MRMAVYLLLLGLIGCGTAAPRAARTPEQHAANIAAAERAGFKVVTNGERTSFCPGASATGSHLAPNCLSEREFESLLGSAGTTPAATFTHASPGPGPNAGH